MRKLATIVFLLFALPLSASHIVGGEIELLHLTGFKYQVNLIYYFDVVNNPGRIPERQEPEIELHIFRKSDNVRLRALILGWVRKTRVPYTQPECSSGEIISDKMLYSAEITLPAAEYSDPQGYYITWARCCRNYTISNIFSQDPSNGGAAAGQTFYLEFPPVTVDGKPFVNSSPKDFPALNDYACPTKPYYVDFAGVDPDGDSLVYSLTVPLSTVTVTPSPPPTPGPYPFVTWRPGYGPKGIVNGNPPSPAYPDLSISQAGFLRVTPRSLGLYVFAIVVEEYRNKVRIGESRRDFQLLVTDCRMSEPPQISGKPLKSGAFVRGNLKVSFPNTVSKEDRCIRVSVADPDANRKEDNYQEVISLKVVPLNFKSKDLSSLLPEKSTGIIKETGTIEFDICFPACPYFEGGPYQVGVIAFDDACALPLSDTLKVEVDVQPPHNERAQFVPPDRVTATLQEGDLISWDFEARDAEKDKLLFFALTSGYSPDRSGLTTEVISNEDGKITGRVTWEAFCDKYDFTRRNQFILRLLVDDVDQCDLNDPDTLTYDLNVELPGNADPVIDTDLTIEPAEVDVGPLERRIFDRIVFQVTGKDLTDNDPLTMYFSGDGFNPERYGMSFAKTSGTGAVTSQFMWDLTCDQLDLLKRDQFNIGFVVVDSIHKCRIRQIDSLVVRVNVKKPLNDPPEISIVNKNQVVRYSNGEATMETGQQLVLQLDVSDGDAAPKDKLSIDLIGMGGDLDPEGWEFERREGQSVLSSEFRWLTECSMFPEEVYERNFYFDFRYADDRCLTAEADTVRVKVKVKDPETMDLAEDPANVFTPNDDGINDFYSMERRDATGTLYNILPPDNCKGVFESIHIYNRWGKTVFVSSDRNFRWLGRDEAAGVYFYHIKYSNRAYKGTVSLRD